MFDIDTVIKEVALEVDESVDLVAAVCKHPFVTTVQAMKDPLEARDILFNKLFKFKLKRRFKEDKSRPYTK